MVAYSGQGGNVGSGHRYQGTMPDMIAYDSLPRRIRKVLAQAPLNYSAEQILRAWVEYLAKYGRDVERQVLVRDFANAYHKAYQKPPRDVPIALAMMQKKNIAEYY